MKWYWFLMTVLEVSVATSFLRRFEEQSKVSAMPALPSPLHRIATKCDEHSFGYTGAGEVRKSEHMKEVYTLTTKDLNLGESLVIRSQVRKWFKLSAQV